MIDPGEVLLILAAAAAAAVLTAIRTQTTPRSNDHEVHHALVGLIRAGGHRFLKDRSFLVYPQEIAYPHLFHWLVSFLPAKQVERRGGWAGAAFAALSAAAFVAFAVRLRSGPAGVELSDAGLATAAVLFVLTPYAYDARDPKHRGFSARGFGLLFGQLYLYALALWILEGSVPFLAAASGVVAILFLSSQFATQMVVLSAPVLALVAGDPWLLVAPLVGLALPFALAPNIAWRELRGTLRKKRHFARHLAARTLLRNRPGIWSEWTGGFWQRAWALWKKKKRGMHWWRLLDDVYSNPVSRLVLGYPALVVFLAGPPAIAMPWLTERPDAREWMAAGVVAMLVLFVATSLRTTRFLGLPERYLEFAMGFLVLAVVLSMGPGATTWAVGFSSALLVAWELGPRGRRVHGRRLIGDEDAARIDALLASLEPNPAGPLRLLSNNRTLAKRFLRWDRRVFLESPTDEVFAGLRAGELLADNGRIHDHWIPELVERFAIDVLIYDRKGGGDAGSLLRSADFGYEPLLTVGDVEIVRVRFSVARDGS